MSPLARMRAVIAGISSQDEAGLEVWRRRSATLVAALLVGLAAMAIAWLSDIAQSLFVRFDRANPYWALAATPVVFLSLAWATRRFAPETRGSGIPQVIAAAGHPDHPDSRAMLSLKAAVAKILLTCGAFLGGASVGREGPTVQVGAAIMVQVHRVLRVPMTSGVMIAGGAAGVSAAFNTPLAGISFAIEELAVAYEQRVAVLVMGAVMIAGLTSQGLAGDYIYFGRMTGGLPVQSVLLAAPLAGVLGGVAGGLFARLLLELRGPEGRFRGVLGRHPYITALACAAIVAGLGVATGGLTWGTGYEPTRELLTGGDTDMWFGPAKFLATVATAASGLPGGIFAPSLAVGAGFGELLTPLFPAEHAGVIVLLGMAAYFVGVVRAPLTAVIIISEATGNTSAILPLFATALIGDWAASMVCKERLYHALSRDFVVNRMERESATAESVAEANAAAEKSSAR
ncbi:MAG: chloride channel protein [Sphingomonadales bacterium]|nr:chloride channel protein [Sphingomonadales bacterium]MBD3773984.1 chloride channel protein [Paracoccaceae bacterium]